MIEKLKTWWRLKRCQHVNCKTETWIINDGGASVETRTTCKDCGNLILSHVNDHGVFQKEMHSLLKQAEALPPGTRQLVKL